MFYNFVTLSITVNVGPPPHTHTETLVCNLGWPMKVLQTWETTQSQANQTLQDCLSFKKVHILGAPSTQDQPG